MGRFCKWFDKIDISDVGIPYCHLDFCDYYFDPPSASEDACVEFAHPDGHWHSCSRAMRAHWNRSGHIRSCRDLWTRPRRRNPRKLQKGGRRKSVEGRDLTIMQ